MNRTKFSFRFAPRTSLRLILLTTALAVSAAQAQRTPEETKPDVSNKAFLTKKKPAAKTKAAKKTAEKGTVKQYSIEHIMATTRIGGGSFSPDEKSILFNSNKSGIFNVYTMPVRGGEAKQLTNSTKESTYAVSY